MAEVTVWHSLVKWHASIWSIKFTTSISIPNIHPLYAHTHTYTYKGQVGVRRGKGGVPSKRMALARWQQGHTCAPSVVCGGAHTQLRAR